MGPPGFEPGSKAPKAPSIAKLTHGPLLVADINYSHKDSDIFFHFPSANRINKPSISQTSMIFLASNFIFFFFKNSFKSNKFNSPLEFGTSRRISGIKSIKFSTEVLLSKLSFKFLKSSLNSSGIFNSDTKLCKVLESSTLLNICGFF